MPGFLRQLGCELISTYDTAGSVKMIKEQQILDGAASGFRARSRIYDHEDPGRLRSRDSPNNFTRFFVLAKNDAPPTGNDKTSIVFSVKTSIGALVCSGLKNSPIIKLI